MYIHSVDYTIVPVPSSPGPSCRRGSFYGSFIVSQGEGLGELYFEVQNKNIVMADPERGFKFTCLALVHPDYHTLIKGTNTSAESDIASSKDKEEALSGNGEGVDCLLVAVVFEGGSFKWYSTVCNRCRYLLSMHPSVSDMSLPTWDILRKKRSLTVTSDMVVQYVGGCSSGGCVQDVSGLIGQLLLPPLRTTRGAAMEPKPRYIMYSYL